MENIALESRCKYFVDIGIWPKVINLHPQEWLTNFKQDEKRLATRLLEGLIYYSTELTQQMFKSAFLMHSQNIITPHSNYLTARDDWSRYTNSIIVVRVTGEKPNDSDSGYTFTRYARDILQIEERNILNHEDALKHFSALTSGHLLFVDDFVGSGKQFVETWERKYTINNAQSSFKSLAKNSRGKVTFSYCPVLCTEKGKTYIHRHCPEVILSPAHLLTDQHSALSNDSYIWREDMASEGPEFIKSTSQRAGIPDLNGEVGCWRGFHKLGLAISFDRYWPDATLPLFYHQSPGWKPLLRKGVP